MIERYAIWLWYHSLYTVLKKLHVLRKFIDTDDWYGLWCPWKPSIIDEQTTRRHQVSPSWQSLAQHATQENAKSHQKSDSDFLITESVSLLPILTLVAASKRQSHVRLRIQRNGSDHQLLAGQCHPSHVLCCWHPKLLPQHDCLTYAIPVLSRTSQFRRPKLCDRRVLFHVRHGYSIAR